MSINVDQTSHHLHSILGLTAVDLVVSLTAPGASQNLSEAHCLSIVVS
jgi:hypothetical protein